MNRQATLLVADEDAVQRGTLEHALAAHGYRVLGARDAGQVDLVLQCEAIDLVILDSRLSARAPACRRAESVGGPPVIVLCSPSAESERISALERGADRCLPRPCSQEELLANLRAVLRRHAGGHRSMRRFAGYTMDLDTHEVHDPAGVPLPLSVGEYGVLRVFVERPQRVLARDQILDAARGRDSESFDRAVDIQVSRLRRKLGAGQVEFIRTVRNEGYMFVPRVDTLSLPHG